MMRKQLSFTTALNQFLRKEDGVAFITFGIFIALLAVALLAMNIDFGRSYGSQTEIRSKLEEYANPITQEYGELWMKGRNCSVNPSQANCAVNADEKQRVFMQDLATYFPGGKEINKAAASADMQQYIERAFNEDLGKLRFQPIEAPVVAINCNASAGRQYLTFRAKAPQFGTFWEKGANETINIEVERLTNVPCNFGDLPNTTTPNSYTPPAGGEMCTHGEKPRTGSEDGRVSTAYTSPIAGNNVDGDSARSVVNFVMSLDANSSKDMGGSNAFVSRFANSLRNVLPTLGNQNKVAAGLTMGNFPMEGAGAPKCADNGSGLPNSGSCYDDTSTMAPITRASTSVAGLQNMSRKDALSGEFRAQYTRRCAPEDAVWTYETVDRGSCFERGYAGQESNQRNHHVWFLVPATATENDIKTIGNIGQYYDRNTAVAACQSQYGADAENVWGEPWVHALPTDPAPNPGECAAAGYGNDCRRVSIAMHCIVKDGRTDYRVFAGKWTPACRSTELGNDANRTYTPPSDLVNFEAELVADLEGNKIAASAPAIKLQSTIALSPTPTTMRSIDAKRLNLIDKLHPLNVKNTERSFNWACDSGPLNSAGQHVANGGNLTTPYGERVDSSRALLEIDGTTRTSLANSANDGKGCSVPALTTNAFGQMDSTVATYDMRFTRANCPNEPCDVPEGMYAVSMRPSRPLQGTNNLPTASRIPQNGLTTSWIPEAGARDGNQGNRLLWAWKDIGNVTDGQNNGQECPKPAGNLACIGEWITANDGQRYCTKFQYDTVQQLNAGVCGADGSNCPNIAKYILKTQDDDVQQWPAISTEKLNIASIGLERRQKADTTGQAVPYMCTLDKGETNTSNRSSEVAIAGGLYNSDPQCNWRNGDPFFCSTRSNGAPTSAEQVEQFFIDSAYVSGNQGLGIFALNANNFSNGTVIPLGDDMEQWRGDGLSTNFRTRNLKTSGQLKSTYDTNMGIMPVPVQNEEVVRYINSDLPPDNMEIKNDNNQLERVLIELARGYGSFQILNHHTGNQCALIKTGLRSLWNGIDSAAGHETSKFLVYVGALPSASDFTADQAKHLANSKSSSSDKPGLYDDTALKLKGKPMLPSQLDPNSSNSVDPASLILRNCIKSADQDKSTTPFVVTTLPDDADDDAVNNILESMRAATENTTNESCKRPFCLLSNTDGEFGAGKHKGPGGDGQGIMTPETCAAKLWKCITPATTKF